MMKLVINSKNYILRAYDISYKFLPDSDCIILYDNLVQLENSSVPNQLNKG